MSDDSPLRLPIELDTTSNGEFAPVPLGRAARFANRRARERAFESARRLGASRRTFLRSACGAACSLLAMNEAFAPAPGCASPRMAFEPARSPGTSEAAQPQHSPAVATMDATIAPSSWS